MNLLPLIGIPYKAKGRSYTGADCWGVCCLFLRDIMGEEVPSYDLDYKTSTDRASVANAIETNRANWRAVEKPRFGDVLLFNVLGLPIHTGIYIGNGDFLHGFMKTDSCVERLDSITWQRRLAGIIRWEKN